MVVTNWLTTKESEEVKGILSARKILTVMYVVILSWLIVSAYFFCQHYVIIRYYPINEKVHFQDVDIKVKELTLKNFIDKRRDRSSPIWYHGFAAKLSNSLYLPFIKVCSFYSRPYEFDNNYGLLGLSGIMVPNPINKEINLKGYRVDFDLYNHQYSGWTWRTASTYPSNNVAFFEKRKKVPLNLKEFNA